MSEFKRVEKVRREHFRNLAAVRTAVLDFLPVDQDYSPTIVADYLIQHCVNEQTCPETGRPYRFDRFPKATRFGIIKSLLDSLVAEGLVERGYGAGPTGRETLTYNANQA